MTPTEQVEAVKAALAEAGYPDAVVEWTVPNTRLVADEPTGTSLPVLRTIGAPPLGLLGAYWRACRLVGTAELRGLVPRCWPCYRDSKSSCTHDWRTEPGPPLPERAGG